MSEYIGSRISLISKSDIRYVGTLKAIDSDTATVSLEGVTCHGSEGRKGSPELEVPGTDVVYEGIVFRGSDVKDLTILSPPQENKPPQMPNDPAILGTAQPAQPTPAPPQPQAQQPPPNQYRGPPPPHQQNQFGYQGPPPPHFQQQPRFQGPGGPHGFPGSPGAVPGYGMGYGGPPPGYGMGMGYGGPPPPPPGQGFQQHPHGSFPPQNQMPIGTPGAQANQQRPPPPPAQQQAPIGSKQGTPQPAANQAPQPPPQAKLAEAVATPGASAGAPTGPPPPLDSKPPTSAATAPSSASQPLPPAATKAAQRANARIAVPLPAPNADVSRARPKPAGAQQAPAVAAIPQPPSTANATDAATAAVAAAMAKLGAVNSQAAGVVDNLAQKVGQMRVQDGQTRGRGRGRGAAPRGGRRESAQKTVDVPKEDFDFESANAKFNKQELAKEAIATGSPMPGADALSTAPAASLLPTNGHNDHADDADDDVVVPAKPSTERGYDKKSSFFDNISSDLRDRVEQQRGGGEQIDGRSMRREERTKNVETFGQGSIDGGYRGRGRGRGRGFGRGRGYFGPRGGMRGRGRGGAEAAPI